jgi:hypothetical protein
MNRKDEIRGVVLDILFGKEQTVYDASQFAHLALGVAEVMERRSAPGSGVPHARGDSELGAGDKMILQEVFWDLFVEKVITIGLNADNPAYPWFRLHSEAKKNARIG